mmetsp:Transcript_6266/g.7291  ORF Transcript_6266/g.7291 Transcript_6266/m.7291 type:complete len:299 (+) Transcript_6266:64-960(+)
MEGSTDTSRSQTLFIVRHGDRWDYSHPEWSSTAARPGDPPLSSLGHRQARDVGRYLDEVFARENIHARDITLLSSPFLRCIQTSNELLSEFHKTQGDVAETVSIQPEYSVFELDSKDRGWHASLPTLAERKCYFPRMEEAHESMFVPTLPENRGQFLDRCEDVIRRLNTKYQHPDGECTTTTITDAAAAGGSVAQQQPRVIVIVTHAAGCVAMAKSASGKELQDINPAPPCGIYRLDRVSDSEAWDIDHYSKEGGMNGYKDHLGDVGVTTKGWNNFGDDKVNNGYTGPPGNTSFILHK